MRSNHPATGRFFPFLGVVLGTALALAAHGRAEPGTPSPDNAPAHAPIPEPTWNDLPSKLAPGIYDAGNQTLVLHDTQRNKDVQVRVRFPKTKAATVARPADGPFPLIVFSHGMGGSRDGFAALSAYLASHGYIVVHPTHADSITLDRHDADDEIDPHTGRPRPRLRDLSTIRRPRLTDVDPYDRVADVSFVYDSLDQIEQGVEDLRLPDGRGKIDRQRLGIAGHSAGAMTAQMVLGAKVRGGGFRKSDEDRPPETDGDGGEWILSSYADPRARAGVVISSQGTTNRLFTEDSWKSVDAPMLVVGGSNDQLPGRDSPSRRKDAFTFSRGVAAGGPPAYLLYIQDAYHSTYSGGRADSEAMRQMTVTATNAAALALFDAYLKDDPAAKQFLASPEGMDTISEHKAKLEAK